MTDHLETPAQTPEIRLLVVDDHALFREGLAGLLAREPGMRIVGKCATATEALEQLEHIGPTMVLLDSNLGSENAMTFVREARQRGFNERILVVTAGVSDEEAVQLVRAGVSGILHKTNLPEVLCDSIRQVAHGKVCIENRYLRPLFQRSELPRGRTVLTTRDKGILRGILQGHPNKEIAAHLELSEGSVKAALRQLFQTFHVHTRAQLVKVVLEKYRDEL